MKNFEDFSNELNNFLSEYQIYTNPKSQNGNASLFEFLKNGNYSLLGDVYDLNFSYPKF